MFVLADDRHSYTRSEALTRLAISGYHFCKLIALGDISPINGLRKGQRQLFDRDQIDALVRARDTILPLDELHPLALACPLTPSKGPYLCVHEWEDKALATKLIDAAIRRLERENKRDIAAKLSDHTYYLAAFWQASDKTANALVNQGGILFGSHSGFVRSPGIVRAWLKGGEMSDTNGGRTFIIEPLSGSERARYENSYCPSPRGSITRLWTKDSLNDTCDIVRTDVDDNTK